MSDEGCEFCTLRNQECPTPYRSGEDCEHRATCECCGKQATTHDIEGVPLCHKCMEDTIVENTIADAEDRGELPPDDAPAEADDPRGEPDEGSDE